MNEVEIHFYKVRILADVAAQFQTGFRFTVARHLAELHYFICSARFKKCRFLVCDSAKAFLHPYFMSGIAFR